MKITVIFLGRNIQFGFNNGKSGPIKVSFSEQPFNVSKDFLSVAEKFDKDRRLLDDTNAFFSCGDCYGVRKGPPATSLIY